MNGPYLVFRLLYSVMSLKMRFSHFKLFSGKERRPELSLWFFYSLILTTDVCTCFLFSLKMDCEKLVQEKTEMQRHYVMVSL